MTLLALSSREQEYLPLPTAPVAATVDVKNPKLHVAGKVSRAPGERQRMGVSRLNFPCNAPITQTEEWCTSRLSGG